MCWCSPIANRLWFFYILKCFDSLLDPDHKLKYPKKPEAIYLETYLFTKPGRRTVRVVANRKIRVGCFASMGM